jgi:hypothetical protein
MRDGRVAVAPCGEHVDARRRGETCPPKNVELEKVWDVESATGKRVLNVGPAKNEPGTCRIPLNRAARDVITRMLKRADEFGTRWSMGCASRTLS